MKVKQEFDVEFWAQAPTLGRDEMIVTGPEEPVEPPEQFRLELVQAAISCWHSGDEDGELWVVENNDETQEEKWYVWDSSDMFQGADNILFHCSYSVRETAFVLGEHVYMAGDAASIEGLFESGSES